MILLVVAVGAAIFALPAAAGQPTKYPLVAAFSGVMTDLCPFSINVDSTFNGHALDFVDKNGVVVNTRIHVVEQDTFTANGKTLVGLPFTANQEVVYDSSGNVTSIVAHGIAEKIPLPDGSLYISAGWLDFTAHPGGGYVISVDRGNPGDMAGFCAALAP